MHIYEQLRKELDELYELTNHDPIVYQKILELTDSAYNIGWKRVMDQWNESNNK